MDMENQTRVLELVEKHGTFAGPLTGVQLELPVYHIFELKDIIPEDVWEEQISMMEMVLDVDAIIKEVATYRERIGG